jgi:nucleotide-binding universal stress UspA family protein
LGDVQAGEALQRVLLTATVEGLAVSFLSQLVEVPDVRDAVERLVGTIRPPAVVLRIGYGWPTTRTLRRPVADLLVGPHGPVGRWPGVRPGLPSPAVSGHTIYRPGLLKGLGSWRSRHPDVPIDPQVARGAAAGHLLEASVTARLLVLGTRARGAAARAVLRSTSRTVLRRSSCPWSSCAATPSWPSRRLLGAVTQRCLQRLEIGMPRVPVQLGLQCPDQEVQVGYMVGIGDEGDR